MKKDILLLKDYKRQPMAMDHDNIDKFIIPRLRGMVSDLESDSKSGEAYRIVGQLQMIIETCEDTKHHILFQRGYVD
jgi:hypothetical protein